MSGRDLLVVVDCYSGDWEQVERQLDSYLHHGAPVLLLSPEDAPVSVELLNVECRSAGLSGWKGAHVAYKLLYHWKIMLEYPQNWFLMHEPDSVCLEPDLPDYLFQRPDTLITAWLGVPGQPGGNSAPPWFGHRQVFERLVEVSEEHIEEWNASWGAPEPDGAGMGNSEMVAQAIDTGNIPYDAFQDFEWVYQESDPLLLVRRAAEGRMIISGLKTAQTYSSVRAAYAARS